MKLHLHSRLYHLLWTLWPKRQKTVDGYNIIYTVLPKWLILGGTESKHWFPDGYVLTHKPSAALMIFLSRHTAMSPQFCYTLYHEYLEGRYLLKKLDEAFVQEFKSKFQAANEYLGHEVQNILDRALTQKDDPDPAHFFALTIELAFAKKEMPKNEFLKHLEDALENRL